MFNKFIFNTNYNSSKYFFFHLFLFIQSLFYIQEYSRDCTYNM